MQHGVKAVLDRRSIGDHRCATIGQAALRLGGVVGLPDMRKEVRPKELREDEGIDLVGLHLRLRDGARAPRVRDDDFHDQGSQEVDDAPGVGCRLHRDAALLQVSLRESEELFAIAGEALAMSDAPIIVQNARFNDALVDVKAGEWHSSSRAKRAGSCRLEDQTSEVLLGGPGEIHGPRGRSGITPTDWAERQLPIRARGSTGWAGGAVTYDSGLEAQGCNRPAPRCSTLSLRTLLEMVFVSPRPMPGARKRSRRRRSTTPARPRSARTSASRT
jgi:hypothetical protein